MKMLTALLNKGPWRRWLLLLLTLCDGIEGSPKLGGNRGRTTIDLSFTFAFILRLSLSLGATSYSYYIPST